METLKEILFQFATISNNIIRLHNNNVFSDDGIELECGNIIINDKYIEINGYESIYGFERADISFGCCRYCNIYKGRGLKKTIIMNNYTIIYN